MFSIFCFSILLIVLVEIYVDSLIDLILLSFLFGVFERDASASIYSLFGCGSFFIHERLLLLIRCFAKRGLVIFSFADCFKLS